MLFHLSRPRSVSDWLWFPKRRLLHCQKVCHFLYSFSSFFLYRLVFSLANLLPAHGALAGACPDIFGCLVTTTITAELLYVPLPSPSSLLLPLSPSPSPSPLLRLLSFSFTYLLADRRIRSPCLGCCSVL